MMMNLANKIVFVATISLFSSSCIWAEALKPSQLAESKDCMRVSLYKDKKTLCFINMNEGEKDAVKRALVIVSEIYQSKALKDALTQYDRWITDPTNLKSKTNGEAIYQTINAIDVSHVQFISGQPGRNPFGSTKALANPCIYKDSTTKQCSKGIMIKPSQIKFWNCESFSCRNREGRLKAKSYLVNTVAHEITHLHTVKGDILYKDQGWTDATKPRLVSYRVGQTVACIYLVRNGIYKSTSQCLKANKY